MVSSAPPAIRSVPSGSIGANACPLCGANGFPTVGQWYGMPLVRMCGACKFAWRPMALPSTVLCLREKCPIGRTMTVECHFGVFGYACRSCKKWITFTDYDAKLSREKKRKKKKL